MFRSIRRRQVDSQTVQELSDSLVQIWEEIPQDTIRRLIRSMPDVVRYADKHRGRERGGGGGQVEDRIGRRGEERRGEEREERRGEERRGEERRGEEREERRGEERRGEERRGEERMSPIQRCLNSQQFILLGYLQLPLVS
ncbi:hypothetical protein D4764_07G0000900 [Takifugu flavidus]|uniref:Uncharacterized protein n=1 Tax=Takifugu flavidus TaxID=433684 RepID=A0A5C6MTA9_9TELE|nr:hypothetical protein D4764_07G0000900 [Takifugu flavidus]